MYRSTLLLRIKVVPLKSSDLDQCSICALCQTFYIFKLINWLIGLVGRVFANGLGDLGSIPGHVLPKTLKMVLDTSLLNTQWYKVHIKGKME